MAAIRELIGEAQEQIIRKAVQPAVKKNIEEIPIISKSEQLSLFPKKETSRKGVQRSVVKKPKPTTAKINNISSREIYEEGPSLFGPSREEIDQAVEFADRQKMNDLVESVTGTVSFNQLNEETRKSMLGIKNLRERNPLQNVTYSGPDKRNLSPNEKGDFYRKPRSSNPEKQFGGIENQQYIEEMEAERKKYEELAKRKSTRDTQTLADQTNSTEASVGETNGENGRNWVRYAVGAATGGGLVLALSDRGGQQTNAQLYGQQPLY